MVKGGQATKQAVIKQAAKTSTSFQKAAETAVVQALAPTKQALKIKAEKIAPEFIKK